MANTTPLNFAIQTWEKVSFFDKGTGELIATSTDVKSGGLDNAMELVYPMGGPGNLYVGPAFAHSKRGTINFTFATIDIALMGAQMGSSVVNGATTYTFSEILTVTGNTATPTHAAVNSDVDYVYVLDANGIKSSSLTQTSGTPTGTTFKYNATATPTLTFSGIADSTQIEVYYPVTTGASTKTIIQSATASPKAVRFVGDAIIKDKCTGTDYLVQVEAPFAQIDGAWNWELAAASDPATQTMKLEFIKPCGSNNLYTMKIINEGDIA
jgi:hypothetical protein